MNHPHNKGAKLDKQVITGILQAWEGYERWDDETNMLAQVNLSL